MLRLVSDCSPWKILFGPHVVFKFCCNTRGDMSLESREVINLSFIFNHHSSWKGGGWRGPLAELQMPPKLGGGLLLCIESISDGIFVHFSTLSSFLPYWCGTSNPVSGSHLSLLEIKQCLFFWFLQFPAERKERPLSASREQIRWIWEKKKVKMAERHWADT